MLGVFVIWKTYLYISCTLLAFLLRFCFNISCYVLSSYCHIFCDIHQSLLQQNTLTTWCGHPHTSLLDIANFSLFPQNVNIIIMEKKFNFSFIRSQGLSTKRLCAFANCNLAVHVFIRVKASSSLIGILAQVNTGLVSLYIMALSVQQHYHKLLCLCFVVDTHISYQNTFISGT